MSTSPSDGLPFLHIDFCTMEVFIPRPWRDCPVRLRSRAIRRGRAVGRVAWPAKGLCLRPRPADLDHISGRTAMPPSVNPLACWALPAIALRTNAVESILISRSWACAGLGKPGTQWRCSRVVLSAAGVSAQLRQRCIDVASLQFVAEIAAYMDDHVERWNMRTVPYRLDPTS